MPKMIFKPIGCSVQTMHLSCVKIDTICKRTNTSFYLTHVTYEFHQCIQNDFGAYGMFVPNRAPMLSHD
jgi:hypothetical protein